MCTSNYYIPTAQAISILGCALLSGTLLSLSLFTIPTLTLPPRPSPSSPINIHPTPFAPPPHLTHQWLYTYKNTQRILSPLATVTFTGYTYLAWCLRNDPTARGKWYLLACAVMVGMFFWNHVVMRGVNGRLEGHARRDDKARAEGAEGMKMSEQEVAKRGREDTNASKGLRLWILLNGVMAMFPLGAAGVGFCAGM
ncbi:uncharacterized protein ACHE_11507A [Aspergillus chevalieri]|uniref:DUF1772-domain-containing protein n=1 Tax=Aspergillus chevalieri TaxID=182096 RepID=A0A7R7VG69_ASPCH|nr:uncharacterized protein ACHE_11507A [Aspergillus chevalieri]BCR84105.1 hypothetical protein ACHE_11507A [Aspergillus chevalieri]